ncbi:MAG: MFS transporter [Gemmatimonadales bacterium]|nr:MAG: MFS transporter [Gemmatimonadales bacterium]
MGPSGRRQPGAWERLWLFFAANILFAGGLFSHAFLYNFYLDDLGLGESVMGLAAAALTAGGLVALVPAGVLVDRRGTRFVYGSAAVAAAVGLAVGGFVESPWAIYGAAGLAGAGATSWRVASGPILMRLAPPAIRPRAFSWNVALLLASGAGWTAASGFLPGWLEAILPVSPGSGIRWSLVLGAAGTGLGGFVYLLIPHTPDVPAATHRPEPALRRGFSLRALALPPVLTASVGLVLVWMMGSALVLPFFNLYFLRIHGLGVDRIGLLLGAAQAAAALAVFGSGLLAERLGLHRTLRYWMVIFPPALWALAGVGALLPAGALFLLLSLVPPATNPLIDQALLEEADPARRGTVSSWRNGATELAGLIGASAGGVLLEAATFGVLFGVAGGVALVGALGLGRVLRRLRVEAGS